MYYLLYYFTCSTMHHTHRRIWPTTLHHFTHYCTTIPFNTQPIWRLFQVLSFLLKFHTIWPFQVLSLLLKHSNIIFFLKKNTPPILHTTSILPFVIFTYNINLLQSSSSFFPYSLFETQFFTFYHFFPHPSFVFVELFASPFFLPTLKLLILKSSIFTIFALFLFQVIF